MMKYFRWFLIFTLLLIAIYHLRPHFAEIKQIPNVLKKANFIYLFIAAVAIIGQYIGDGWLSKVLLEITGHKINLKQTVKIASIDVFAAHILPVGEAGVIATTAYFYKKLGVANQAIIFLTITWGIITNAVLFIFLLASMLFLPKLPNLPIHIANLAKGAVVLILISIPITLILRKTILSFLKVHFKNIKIFIELERFFQNLKEHKNSFLTKKILLFEALTAASIYFAANVASLYFCFMAFGQTQSIAIVTFAYFLSLIASFITLAPAGIGASEATMILIFLQFGLNPALVTISVLTFRIFTFWLPIPAGLLSYLSLKNAPSTAP